MDISKYRAGTPLSPLQQATWEFLCKNESLTRQQQADALGINLRTLQQRVSIIYKKKPDLLERRKAAIELQARDIADPKPLKHAPSEKRLTKVLKDVTSHELEANFGQIAFDATDLAREFLDDQKARPLEERTVTLKELGIIAGISTDKRAILRGEPTQIIQHEDMHRADQVSQKILQELVKRGVVKGDVTIDSFVSNSAEDAEIVDV
jgi:hypothetical protein